jgi:hypothetical protein
LVGGRPLTEDRHAAIREALGIAARELAEGRTIPAAAQELMGEQIVPNRALQVLGRKFWRGEAKQYGTLQSLGRQPYGGRP